MLDQVAAVEDLRLIASLAARGPEWRELLGGNISSVRDLFILLVYIRVFNYPFFS